MNSMTESYRLPLIIFLRFDEKDQFSFSSSQEGPHPLKELLTFCCAA